VDDLARNLADKIPDLPETPVVQNAGTITASREPQIEPRTEPRVAPQMASHVVERSEQKGKGIGAPPSTLTRPDQDCYQVQVAAFSKPGEAQHAVQLLRGEGFRPTVLTVTRSEKSPHRVMLGPFLTFGAAQETGAKVQKRLRFSPVVVRFLAP
jgi:cell division septation protein DedD